MEPPYPREEVPDGLRQQQCKWAATRTGTGTHRIKVSRSMGKTDLCKSALSPRVVSSGHILRCGSSLRTGQFLKHYCHSWRSRSASGDLHLVASGKVRA